MDPAAHRGGTQPQPGDNLPGTTLTYWQPAPHRMRASSHHPLPPSPGSCPAPASQLCSAGGGEQGETSPTSLPLLPAVGQGLTLRLRKSNGFLSSGSMRVLDLRSSSRVRANSSLTALSCPRRRRYAFSKGSWPTPLFCGTSLLGCGCGPSGTSCHRSSSPWLQRQHSAWQTPHPNRTTSQPGAPRAQLSPQPGEGTVHLSPSTPPSPPASPLASACWSELSREGAVDMEDK